MGKKILIAVDQSINSKSAMKYAARIFSIIPDVSFDLLYVQPMISQYLLEDARNDPKARTELKHLSERNKQAAFELLENCRKKMVQMGVDESRITLKTHAREMGIADEILRLAEMEYYDALLVGRRGVSAFKELFMGSVTTNLLAHSTTVPVWVVDGEVSFNNLLIAVDGSAHSLRAVEHAAFILSGSIHVYVHMLHVEPRLGDYCEIAFEKNQTAALEERMIETNRKCIDDFRPKAYELFRSADVPSDRISFSVYDKKFSPGRAIVDQAHKGGYGTIVLGKRGAAGEGTQMGKVATMVSQKASNSAVWIVP